MSPLSIMIGFDTRQITAYHVAVHSIIQHASCPVSITPIALSHLARVFTRAPTGSTEFSISRFLTPALAQYQGYAIYLDSDVFVRCDLAEMLVETIRQPDKAVWVCQHAYTPAADTKMWGADNKPYPRKNWSSVVLFDCTKCRMLTPEYVNTATPMELHRFTWVPDDQIGSLPLAYNHLVGEYPPHPDAKIYHYTLGTPNLPGYQHCDHADLWWAAARELLTPCQG